MAIIIREAPTAEEYKSNKINLVMLPKIKKLKIDLKFDSYNELKEEEKLIIKGA